jgi:hypothetical protein
VEWEYVQSKDTLLTAENCGILGGNNCKFLRYYSKKAMDLVLQRGFAMLRQLEVELDYRDGLVDFKYDPKRVNPFVR